MRDRVCGLFNYSPFFKAIFSHAGIDPVPSESTPHVDVDISGEEK